MSNLLKVLTGVVVGVVVVTGYALFKPNVPTGTFVGPDVYDFVVFHAGTIRNNYLATSTPSTTYTLEAKDMVRPNGVPYDTVSITPTVGDLTLTFPASSSLKHFLPKAGMSATQCWHNASTTAGIDITFAAGTGIDLQTASSSILEAGPVLTLLADADVCFDFLRKPATASAFDITVNMTRYADGD